MTQASPYTQSSSFTNIHATLGEVPGASLDIEFGKISESIDEIIANLAAIQADDTSLRAGSVGAAQLSNELQIGFNTPEPWVEGAAYVSSPASIVVYGPAFYRCAVSHVAGASFAPENWDLLLDMGAVPIVSAAQVAVVPTGGVSSVTVQAALAELDSEKAALGHAHHAADISDSTSIGRALLLAQDAAEIHALLSLSGAQFVSGDVKPTAALTAPSGWLFCDGAAVSRTTYAALFSAITLTQAGTLNGTTTVTGLASTAVLAVGFAVSGVGIAAGTTVASVDSGTQVTLSQAATASGVSQVTFAPHGVGDGATTFNVPDYRDSVLVGRGNMGGTAANRITLAATGFRSTSLGARGGAETHTLTSAQMPSHSHAGTSDAAGAHLHTVSYGTITGLSGGGGGTASQVGGSGSTANTSTAADHTHAFTTGVTGGGLAHNNVQPSAAVNYLIKT